MHHSTKMKSNQQFSEILATNGISSRMIESTHSPNGCSLNIAWDEESLGEKPPLGREHRITCKRLEDTFDDRGYRGRGRTGYWYALKAAKDGEDAFFLTSDPCWKKAGEPVEGGSYRDTTFYLVPHKEADKVDEDSFGSIAHLF